MSDERLMTLDEFRDHMRSKVDAFAAAARQLMEEEDGGTGVLVKRERRTVTDWLAEMAAYEEYDGVSREILHAAMRDRRKRVERRGLPRL